MTPGVIVLHVSKGYGVKVSDKTIFNQSNIIEFMEPHVDLIMMDKGFLIEDECRKSYVGLVCPPFAKCGQL